MIAIRASSLAALFDCPARWEAIHIDGIRMPTSPAALLGKAVHKGAQAFDEARFAGSPISAGDAADAVVDTIRRPEDDVDWSEDKRRPQDVESVALALHTRYCMEIAPSQTYTAIEVTCAGIEIDDLGITLTGTPDRVRRDADGRLGLADLKTGRAAVDAQGRVKVSAHAAQIGVYELLVEQGTGQAVDAPAQIIGFTTAAKPGSQRIAIGNISNARSLLLGTPEQPGALEYAARILQSGLFFGNSRSMLCASRFCPIFARCRFRGQ